MVFYKMCDPMLISTYPRRINRLADDDMDKTVSEDAEEHLLGRHSACSLVQPTAEAAPSRRWVFQAMPELMIGRLKKDTLRCLLHKHRMPER